MKSANQCQPYAPVIIVLPIVTHVEVFENDKR
jgi:hypothetical protein